MVNPGRIAGVRSSGQVVWPAGPAAFPGGDGAWRRDVRGASGRKGLPSVSRFWKEIFVQEQESRTTAAGNRIMEKGSP